MRRRYERKFRWINLDKKKTKNKPIKKGTKDVKEKAKGGTGKQGVATRTRRQTIKKTKERKNRNNLHESKSDSKTDRHSLQAETRKFLPTSRKHKH